MNQNLSLESVDYISFTLLVLNQVRDSYLHHANLEITYFLSLLLN